MPKGLKRTLEHVNAGQVMRVLRVPFRHTVAVAAVGAAAGFGAVALAPLPRGAVAVTAVSLRNLKITAAAGIGATFAANVSLTDAPGSAADINTGSVSLITSQAATIAEGSVSETDLLTGNVVDMISNEDGSKELNLNIQIAAGDITDGASTTVVVEGTLGVIMAAI